ncbi:MAG: hypothetical protein NTW37_06425, partial [Proteobacteria bacterium]|nr:hypothetical protein [Pseudomonadota bacterium]
ALHPILLDELIDARTLHSPPSWPRLIAEWRDHLDSNAGNVERQLDILRHFKHAQVFRIVAQDLAGDLPLEAVSDRLSELADVVLAEGHAVGFDTRQELFRVPIRLAPRQQGLGS